MAGGAFKAGVESCGGARLCATRRAFAARSDESVGGCGRYTGKAATVHRGNTAPRSSGERRRERKRKKKGGGGEGEKETARDPPHSVVSVCEFNAKAE